jgi:VWFA-related protein
MRMQSFKRGAPVRFMVSQSTAAIVVTLLCAVALVVVLTARARAAQGTRPAQTPPPSAPSSQGQAPTPLRVLSQMVQVDVVVKDRNGKPVTGLTQNDFTVFDEGKKQDIAFFSMETSKSRNVPQPSPPNVYSNLYEQKTVQPANMTIILLDYMNTRHSDTVYARNQVIKLLKSMQPDDRVAVYVLGARLYVLHDFTSDMTGLQRTIEKYETNDSANAIGAAQTAQYTGVGADDYFFNQAAQDISDFSNIVRVFTTTDAMEAIAEHLTRIPGRKNLIWVSSSFPFTIGMDKMMQDARDSAFQNGSAPILQTGAFDLGQKNGSPGASEATSGPFNRDIRNFAPEIDKAARALAGANVSIYPIDARGLIGAFGENPDPGKGEVFGPLTVQRSVYSLSEFAPTIDTMHVLAEKTGGRAFYNTNDITGSIKNAMEDGTVSYLMAFYPTLDDGTGKFHKLKVTLRHPGYEVRYRSGYFAKMLNLDGRVDTAGSIRQALSSPLDATGMGVSVKAAAMDSTTPGERVLGLTIDVAEDDVRFNHDATADRTLGTVKVVIAQFDLEGKMLVSETSTVKMTLRKDTYSQIRKRGLLFGRKLPLVAGATEVRVVACDDKTAEVGSVTVPIAKYFPASH